jgi:hypothetical protein
VRACARHEHGGTERFACAQTEFRRVAVNGNRGQPGGWPPDPASMETASTAYRDRSSRCFLIGTVRSSIDLPLGYLQRTAASTNAGSAPPRDISQAALSCAGPGALAARRSSAGALAIAQQKKHLRQITRRHFSGARRGLQDTRLSPRRVD